MAKFNSRGARLTALALATGTLIVAAGGPAGAAPVPVPDAFGGSARGTAIHIEINLPASLPLTLPTGVVNVSHLEQDISFTQGNTAKGLAPKTTSVAKAVLGNGNIVVLSDALAKSVTSSLDGQTSASDSLQSVDVGGLIKASVGKITSSVAPDSATSALTSSSSSSLARLEVGLGNVALPTAVKTDLNGVVNTLNGTVDEAQGTLTATVDNALATLDQASQGATAAVTAQIAAVKQTLTDLLDSLQQTIAKLSSDLSIVRLSLLESTENITRAGSMVTAKATSSVGGLDILSGLVHVDAVKTESVSSANGAKGAAAADTLTTILGLKVANVLDLKLTANGLEGTLLGNALPDAAKNAVQDVIAQLNSVLDLAGVQIVNGATTKDVDPNGKFASSSSEGVGIVVNPLHAPKPLVSVQLVPAGTAVKAAHAQKPPVVVPPKVNPPTEGTHPHTGANLPLLALFGTALAGAAMVTRRRRVEA